MNRHYRLPGIALLIAVLVVGGVGSAVRAGGLNDFVNKLPDPCAETKYDAAIPNAFEVDGFEGVSYAPDLEGRPLSETTPVILLRHGLGHTYLDYDYLLEHLARQGFIAASVEGTIVSLADHLDYLKSHYGLNADVPIGLIGHSRGGEFVIDFATLNEQAGAPHNIRSVLGLAPSDRDRGSLSPFVASSYFVILGSHDEDTAGWNDAQGNGPPSEIQPKSGTAGFGSYDRAGNEVVFDGDIALEPRMTRSMLFVHGANHNYWREFGGLPPFLPHFIDVDAHHAILKGYAAGWFLWQLDEDDAYKGMFQGSWKPKSLSLHLTTRPDDWGQPAGLPLRMFTQYSAKNRRVIRHFQGAASTDDQNGVVSSGGASHLLHHHSPHDTGAVRVRWTGDEDLQYVAFTVPDKAAFIGGNAKNVSGFTSLNFRVGQIYDATCDSTGRPPCEGLNPFLQDQDFYVILEDDDGEIGFVRASDFGVIPFPARFLYDGNPQQPGGDYSKSAMNTIRVPLSSIGRGIDLTRVNRIIFQFFRGTTGDVLIDSIEFEH